MDFQPKLRIPQTIAKRQFNQNVITTSFKLRRNVMYIVKWRHFNFNAMLFKLWCNFF